MSRDLKNESMWLNPSNYLMLCSNIKSGLIEYNDNEDIFVHYSSIISEGYKSLVEGQYVDFELIKTDKGLQAKNVIEVKTACV